MSLPTTTASKRVAQAQHTPRLLTSEAVIPALDVEALKRKYHPDNYRIMEAAFSAPLDLPLSQWERLRNASIRKFLEVMSQHGMELISENRIQVYDGTYPYRDVVSGEDDWNKREYRIRAAFKIPHPHIVRTEIPDYLVNEIPLASS